MRRGPRLPPRLRGPSSAVVRTFRSACGLKKAALGRKRTLTAPGAPATLMNPPFLEKMRKGARSQHATVDLPAWRQQVRSGRGRSRGIRRRCPGPAEDGPDLHQGCRADLPGEMRGVPPAGFDRADVAADLRGIPPVGEVDQDARRRAPDAAVAHRQGRRHPAVQVRPVAERLADRHDRPDGSTPAHRRATRRTCRPRRTGATNRRGTSRRCSARPSRTSSSARRRTRSPRAGRIPGGSRKSTSG